MYYLFILVQNKLAFYLAQVQGLVGFLIPSPAEPLTLGANKLE